MRGIIQSEITRFDFIEKLLFVLDHLDDQTALDQASDPEIRALVLELQDPVRRTQYEEMRNRLNARMQEGASVEVSMESLRSMKPEDALAQINLQEQAKILGIIEKYGYLKGLSADFFVSQSFAAGRTGGPGGPTHFDGNITPNEDIPMETTDTSATVPAGGTLEDSGTTSGAGPMFNMGLRLYYLLPLTQGLEQSRQGAVVREFELAKSFSDFQDRQRLMAAGMDVLRAQSRVEEASMVHEMWDQRYRQLYSSTRQTDYERGRVSFESGVERTRENMAEAASALEQAKLEFLRALRAVGGDVTAQLTAEELETLQGMTGLTQNDLAELKKAADTLAEEDPRFKMHLQRIKAQTQTLKLMRYDAFGPKIAFVGVVSLLEQGAELQLRLPLLNRQGKARVDLEKAILQKLEAELPLLKDNLRTAAMRMINQLNASIDRLERKEKLVDKARDELVRAEENFERGSIPWDALREVIETYEREQYGLRDAQFRLMAQHELFVEFLRTNGMTDEEIKSVLAIEPAVSEDEQIAERPLPKIEVPEQLIQPGAPYVPSEQPGQYDRAVLGLKFETGAETKDTVFRHVTPLAPGDPRIPLREGHLLGPELARGDAELLRVILRRHPDVHEIRLPAVHPVFHCKDFVAEKFRYFHLSAERQKVGGYDAVAHFFARSGRKS